MYVATVVCARSHFANFLSQMSLLAFAVGQLGFAFTILIGYYGYFLLRGEAISKQSKVFFRIWPSRSSGADRDLLGMVGTFLLQSLEKLVLQEGEKIVLRGVATLVNQGVFGVVNGLGSLVTRILFQPIEEGAYPMFTKLLARTGDATGSHKKTDDSGAPSDDASARHDEARKILIRLLRILALLGLYFRVISHFPPPPSWSASTYWSAPFRPHDCSVWSKFQFHSPWVSLSKIQYH